MSANSRVQQSRLQRPDVSGLRPPNSTVAYFLWRWKMWLGGTFVLSMLEPWETFVLLSFFIMFILLLVFGIFRYLPSQASFLARRAHYYLVGADTNGEAASSWLGAKEL